MGQPTMVNPRWQSWKRQRRGFLLARNLSPTNFTDSLQRRKPSLEKSERRQKSLFGGMIWPLACSRT